MLISLNGLEDDHYREMHISNILHPPGFAIVTESQFD